MLFESAPLKKMANSPKSFIPIPSSSHGDQRLPRPAPPPPSNRRRRRSWHNIGAAYAAVRFLRPQGRSLVLYSGPDGGAQQRIVFAYPILPGDAFERMDGETLSWAEPECGDEFALCFLDEAACAAVSGAISPVTKSLAALDGLAERLAGLRVAREEGGPAGGDIAVRLAAISIGRP